MRVRVYSDTASVDMNRIFFKRNPVEATPIFFVRGGVLLYNGTYLLYGTRGQFHV